MLLALFQYLKKLHLQERVVEEVKMAIKPHYAKKDINKDQYKEILRKAVPKVSWLVFSLLEREHGVSDKQDTNLPHQTQTVFFKVGPQGSDELGFTTS